MHAAEWNTFMIAVANVLKKAFKYLAVLSSLMERSANGLKGW